MSRAVPGRRGRAHSTEPACAGDNGQEIRARRQRDMLRGEGSLSSTEGCRQAQGDSLLLVLGPVALRCSLQPCRPIPWLPAALCLVAHPPAGRESARGQLGSWPPSVSPPANPRWCSTDWVQVSRAMLTPSTVLQDTFLGLALLFLEHRECRGTCTQPGEHPAQCPSTRAACAHTQHAHTMHTPCTLHAHLSLLHPLPRPVAASTARAEPARPHHAPSLLFDRGRGRMMSPAARCRIPRLPSCPWLLAPLPSPEGAVLGPPCSEGLISTLNVFMDNLSPVVPVLMLSFS